MMPGLSEFRQTMRPYQNLNVNYGGIMFEAAQENPPGPQRRQLFTLPTGTGKGSIELVLLQGFQRREIPALHLTTSLEVLRSNLTRCGWAEQDVAEMSADKLAKAAKQINCWTYRGYYEALKRGDNTRHVRAVLLAGDETDKQAALEAWASAHVSPSNVTGLRDTLEALMGIRH